MKTILKTVLALIAVSCAVAVLATRWEEVSAVLAGTSWSLLGLAAVGLLAYQVVNAGVWSTVLAALGTRPGFWSAARVWIESEALRWVPGGIWGYGSRVLSAPSLGVGKGTASASLVVEIILTNLAWAAAALLLLGAPWTGEFLEAVLHSGWIDVAALASAVIVALTVAILATRTGRSAAGRLLDPLLRRVPWQELRWRPVLGAFAAYAALCFFNGSVLW
ncbi:MAG: hypothetical protein HKO57_09765, partial [Akkermansiaceae bacterium]|nr:hypothetical protein [Akkermansiaceae bacterium]